MPYINNYYTFMMIIKASPFQEQSCLIRIVNFKDIGLFVYTSYIKNKEKFNLLDHRCVLSNKYILLRDQLRWNRAIFFIRLD